MNQRSVDWNLNNFLSVVFVATLHVLVSAVSASAADDRTLLRMALLPISDVLPIYVAAENGYFAELGIVVEVRKAGSAVERDQLMQAGSIDGMINEISGAALFNRDEIRMQIVSIARSPQGDSPLFRIMDCCLGPPSEKILNWG